MAVSVQHGWNINITCPRCFHVGDVREFFPCCDCAAELLDAAKAILPFVEEDFPAEGSPVPTTWAYGQAVLKLRAAIKKATGAKP